MEGDSISSIIKNKANGIETTISKIKSIPLKSVWGGESCNQLTTSIERQINTIEEKINNIVDFAKILDILQELKKNQIRLTYLQTQLSNTPDTKEYDSQREDLIQQIDILTKKITQLKNQVTNGLAKLFPNSIEEGKLFGAVAIDYNGFVVDVDEFYDLFSNRELKKISDAESLYKYVSTEVVEKEISNIKQQYSGRDAAVNCALAIMKLAADVGLKLDYDWGGGHTEITDIDSIATGSDCSSFASWAINQGAVETFTTKSTASLIGVGEQIDYSEAQKGDILVYRSNGAGHVVMVVKNNSEEKEFLVVEASGSNEGVIMRKRTYSELSSYNYQARDLTSIYGN